MAAEFFVNLIVDDDYESLELYMPELAFMTLTEDGMKGLDIAVEEGHVETVKMFILNTPGTDYSKLFIRAVELAYFDITKLFIQTGVDVDSTKEDGQTALFQAVYYGLSLELIELLLQSGCDPDIARDDGNTPLMSAVGRQNYDMVKLLLKYNAKPDRGYMFPMTMAVFANDLDMVLLLIDKAKYLKESTIWCLVCKCDWYILNLLINALPKPSDKLMGLVQLVDIRGERDTTLRPYRTHYTSDEWESFKNILRYII